MIAATFANRIEMQNRLFAELSAMFGKEVPLYDKSLLVNRVCNRAVCDLLAKVHAGFSITDEQLERTSGERHGAIRIGRPDEYGWIARFFAAFAMEPHNFYDMANVGAKSQPIIATAFRSAHNPEHRVFSSLLLTDYFDAATRARIEALLKQRQIFSDNARRLIEKCERQGGLDWADADALIREGTERIFKWTGKARDFALYKELCDAGFKIAADISCFLSHHLNHLTPNTLCMDLYTAAMKHCFGELNEAEFRRRAARTLARLEAAADRDHMRLHFKHFSREQLDAFTPGRAGPEFIAKLVDSLTKRLAAPDLALRTLKHSGFKDTTEGPSWDTPVLLRQDSYKALTEPVSFTNPDGSVKETVHTARFGEIEQRFYATTPAGRALYDRCLAAVEAEKDADPDLSRRDFDAYEAMYARHFETFPKTLLGLLEKGLVYARYTPSPKGLAARGALATTDILELVRSGHVLYEGLRYEDFLPVSAAGIFASNLNQYGTKTTAAERPVYTQKRLEEIMGRSIISSDASYAAVHARSLLETYHALGLMDKLPAARRAELEAAAAAAPGVQPQRPPAPVGAGAR
jgi:uncharacterized glyoxalase superfamily metalloenzyme YdcJ